MFFIARQMKWFFLLWHAGFSQQNVFVTFLAVVSTLIKKPAFAGFLLRA